MRLVIVSNRLPITVKEKQGNLSFEDSVGGLATGIRSYLRSLDNREFQGINEYIWVGWPGSEIPETYQEKVKKELLSLYNSYPVFLSQEEIDKFYLGFSNKTIWPLFHGFENLVEWQTQEYDKYIDVNKKVCNALLKIIRKDDLIWIHDYHLLLLPKLLRSKCRDCQIGFFLHIPFPDYETLKQVPRYAISSLVDGILGANLIGFHITEYKLNFLNSVRFFTNSDTRSGYVLSKDYPIKTSTYPMNIDFLNFYKTAGNEEVQQITLSLLKEYGDYRFILSMDRLDYTKGVVEKLKAYNLFLKGNSKFHEKIKLILILVPSRVEIGNYQKTKEKIESLVKKINQKYKKNKWKPINYKYQSLPFSSIVAHYLISDIALITPIKDGMNLIAKEFIASKINKKGVLILSNKAGAAKELTKSLLVDPLKINQITEALTIALNMPKEEQEYRLSLMQQYLMNNNILFWADNFIKDLKHTSSLQQIFQLGFLNTSRRITLTIDQIEEIYQRNLNFRTVLEFLSQTKLLSDPISFCLLAYIFLI